MLRGWLFLSLSLFFPQDDSKRPFSCEALGLRIVKPTPGDLDRSKPPMRAFSTSPETTVCFLVTIPQGGLLELDSSSKLQKVADDKGKDLTQETVPVGSLSPRFRSYGQPSSDGQRWLIEAYCPCTPSQDAKSLSIAGELVFRAASNKESLVADQVALKQGTKFQVGNLAFTVGPVGESKQRSQEGQLTVSLQTNHDLSSVDEIEFFDASGTKVESRRYSASQGSEKGKVVSTNWQYNLSRKIDTAKIVVTRWTDMKLLTFPVQASIGLGL